MGGLDGSQVTRLTELFAVYPFPENDKRHQSVTGIPVGEGLETVTRREALINGNHFQL